MGYVGQPGGRCMSASSLLEKLDGVRKTGASKWIARCPAHDDKSPSLAITECDDGKTLIHCFALCSQAEVLNAVGLEMRDLSPVRLDHSLKPKRRPFDSMQVLRCVALEVQIAACVASDVINGKKIDIDDWARRIRELR